MGTAIGLLFYYNTRIAVVVGDLQFILYTLQGE